MSIESSFRNKEQGKYGEALELLRLDENHRNELKEKIGKSNGLVRAFVHPFFEHPGDKPVESRERVHQVFIRSLFSPNSPPIIIFEYDSQADEWKKIVEDSELPKDVYIVPTVYNYPYPVLPDKPMYSKTLTYGNWTIEDSRYVIESAKTFVKFLNELGVKKILIGGMKLEIIDNQFDRCVGNFIRMMKEFSDVNLKLSLGAAPLNRSNMKSFDQDLL